MLHYRADCDRTFSVRSTVHQTLGLCEVVAIHIISRLLALSFSPIIPNGAQFLSIFIITGIIRRLITDTFSSVGLNYHFYQLKNLFTSELSNGLQYAPTT